MTTEGTCYWKQGKPPRVVLAEQTAQSLDQIKSFRTLVKSLKSDVNGA